MDTTDDFADLSGLDASTSGEKPVFLQLRHPANDELMATSSGKPIGLLLFGRDSAAWKKHQRGITQRLLGRRTMKQSAEEIEENALSQTVALTAGWPVPFQVNGERLTYSPANARKLYQTFPWVKEQADEFIGDRANFLTVSQSSSSSTPEPNSP